AGGPELAAARAAKSASAEAKEGSPPRASSLGAGLDQTLATDLKTSLHRLAPVPDATTDRTAARTTFVPDQALANLARAAQAGLESQQALTHQVWRQDEALLLFIPLALEGRWSLIEFFVRPGGRTGREETDAAGTNVALFLEMSALGPVRVDARVRPGRITCRFTAAQAAAAEVLRRDFDQVAERLEALGYRTELLGVFVKSAEEVDSLSPLVEKLTGRDTGFHVVV
ncbi:MAG: flagellar hook-length control protein FliK, partial [Proteobacteria bacterium]|nr:flagellar hook-length control protein FliK [Pseudomonadota bacterium]